MYIQSKMLKEVKKMKRVLLIIALLIIPVLCYGGEKFGMVFDVEGDVQLKSADGKSLKLKKELHILQPIREGDKVSVTGTGRLLIVSIKDKKGYEIGGDSSAIITDGRIKTIKGTVNVKDGYHAGKEGATGPIGAIVLRSVMRQPCIKTISPINTAVLELTPTLRWHNECKNKNVSVKILAGREVIFNVETADGSIRVSEGILRAGETYRWLVDAGANGIVGGTFSVPEEEKINTINEKLTYYKESHSELPKRLSFVFYLLENSLNEYAKEELSRLEKEFPENPFIKELKR